MSTRQRKRESRRQAREAQRKKSDKELEREIKNKGDEFRWKNNMKILYRRWVNERCWRSSRWKWAAVKWKKRTGTQATNFLSSQRHFLPRTCDLEVWRRNNNGKEMYKKVCCDVQTCFLFLLIGPLNFLAVLVAAAVEHSTILFLVWVNYKFINEGFAISPDKILRYMYMCTLKYDDGTSYRSFRMLIVYLGQTSRSCIPQACYGVAVKVLTSFTTNLSVFQCNFFQLSLVWSWLLI